MYACWRVWDKGTKEPKTEENVSLLRVPAPKDLGRPHMLLRLLPPGPVPVVPLHGHALRHESTKSVYTGHRISNVLVPLSFCYRHEKHMPGAGWSQKMRDMQS